MTGLGLGGPVLAAVLSAAAPPAVIPPASEVVYRHEIYRGDGVTAYLLNIPPGHGTQMHRHEKDILTVFISGGRTTAVFEGAPATSDVIPSGTVRYRSAGFAHSTHNDDERQPFRAVILEFDTAQGGRMEGSAPPQLFCAKGFCADDVTLPPGAALPARRRSLFVAVGGVTVREVAGTQHAQPAGTVWSGPGGWTNGGRGPTRVIAITSR